MLTSFRKDQQSDFIEEDSYLELRNIPSPT